MRLPRVKGEGQSFYHCLSRVVEGRFIFGASEAEQFLSLMRPLEAFSGVRVLTYVLMANHFHLLCEVPAPKPLSQSEVLARIEAGFSGGNPLGLVDRGDGRSTQEEARSLRGCLNLDNIAVFSAGSAALLPAGLPRRVHQSGNLPGRDGP